MRGPYGLLKNGIENVKPILTRGIYIDLAAYKGVATLPEKYEITVADVRGALARQGMKESDIEPGDALLFNIGWWRTGRIRRRTPAIPPTPGREVVDWIIARKPSMIGSDCKHGRSRVAGAHRRHDEERHLESRAHDIRRDGKREELPKFMFVFTPLRLKGATGSPGRPIAVF